MHKGFALWFTGLSGSGKSTLSERIHKRLVRAGARVELLDGDEVRTHLSKGLGFSKEDRDTNVRRIGFVAELKGLYKKALAGEIPHFTGVSDPYEPPVNPELRVDSSSEKIAVSEERVWQLLKDRGLIPLSW